MISDPAAGENPARRSHGEILRTVPALAAFLAGWLLCSMKAEAVEFGAVAGGTNNEFLEKKTPDLKASGINWMRLSSESLAAAGFNETAVLTFREKNAADETRLPTDLLALYWHCRTNLPIYPAVQQAWEVWNEPDFYFVSDNADRMAAAVKAAYWGIRRGNPRAKVLMPSLAFVPGTYARELAGNGIRPYLDGYNFHFYGWAQDFPNWLAAHERFLREQQWRLPIWLTEIGCFSLLVRDAGSPEALARQQAFHEITAVQALASRLDFYFPFILTPYHEDQWDLGLTSPDWQPRPALDSYLEVTRQFARGRPLFRIRHRPTQEFIGLVLGMPDGTWQTIVWSPYRFEEDRLPETGPETNSFHVPGAVGHSEPTDLDLYFQFQSGGQLRQIGLHQPLGLHELSNAWFRVSAEQNLFLQTLPGRYEILDCEWVAVDAAPELPSIPSTHGRGQPHLTPIRPAAAPANDPAESDPSPVIVRISYAPPISADKPSQTYRFNRNFPVEGFLEVYNFSETPKRGKLKLLLPFSWTPAGEGWVQVRADAAFCLAETIQIDGLSKKIVPFRQNPNPERAAPSRRSREMKGGLPARGLVQCDWEGTDGSRDRAANWIEADFFSPVPNLPFPGAGWKSCAGREGQWQIVSMDEKVRLAKRRWMGGG